MFEAKVNQEAQRLAQEIVAIQTQAAEAQKQKDMDEEKEKKLKAEQFADAKAAAQVAYDQAIESDKLKME